MIGGELLCHRFGDEVDGVGRLPVGAYDQPQDLAPLPVGVELGVEAVARVFLGRSNLTNGQKSYPNGQKNVR